MLWFHSYFFFHFFSDFLSFALCCSYSFWFYGVTFGPRCQQIAINENVHDRMDPMTIYLRARYITIPAAAAAEVRTANTHKRSLRQIIYILWSTDEMKIQSKLAENLHRYVTESIQIYEIYSNCQGSFKEILYTYQYGSWWMFQTQNISHLHHNSQYQRIWNIICNKQIFKFRKLLLVLPQMNDTLRYLALWTVNKSEKYKKEFFPVIQKFAFFL